MSLFNDPLKQQALADKLLPSLHTRWRAWLRRCIAWYARQAREAVESNGQIPPLDESLVKKGVDLLLLTWKRPSKAVADDAEKLRKRITKSILFEDPQLLAWLREQAGTKIVAIDETTRDEVRRRLAEAIAAGEGWQGAMRRIRELSTETFPDYRAERIARTEIHTGMALSLDAEARDLGFTEKRWVATIDGRTRQSHALANGQRKPIDQPFLVGGERLRFPHDPAGSAGNVINCRCTITFHGGEAEQVDDKQQVELKPADIYAIRNDATPVATPKIVPSAVNLDDLIDYSKNELGIDVAASDTYKRYKTIVRTDNPVEPLRETLWGFRDLYMRFPKLREALNGRFKIDPYNTESVESVYGFTVSDAFGTNSPSVIVHVFDRPVTNTMHRVKIFESNGFIKKRVDLDKAINSYKEHGLKNIGASHVSDLTLLRILSSDTELAKELSYGGEDLLFELLTRAWRRRFLAVSALHHEVGHILGFVGEFDRVAFENRINVRKTLSEVKRLSAYGSTKHAEMLAEFFALVFSPGDFKTGSTELDEAVNVFRREYGYKEPSNSEMSKLVKALMRRFRRML